MKIDGRKIGRELVNLEVVFEQDDWRNGLARKAIDYLKSANARYMGATKKWILKYDERHLLELEKLQDEVDMYFKRQVQLEAFSQENFDDLFNQAEKEHGENNGN